jgi:hypothetical protein
MIAFALILVSVVLLVCAPADASTASPTKGSTSVPDALTLPARAVSLDMATAPPRFLRMVRPNRGWYAQRQCGRGRFSDVSAYRWDGRALGAQQRTSDVTYWTHPIGGGQVTYYRGVFMNRTNHTVLIVGWCE